VKRASEMEVEKEKKEKKEKRRERRETSFEEDLEALRELISFSMTLTRVSGAVRWVREEGEANRDDISGRN